MTTALLGRSVVHRSVGGRPTCGGDVTVKAAKADGMWCLACYPDPPKQRVSTRKGWRAIYQVP